MHRYDAEPAVGQFNAYYTELVEAADGKLLVFDEVRGQLGDMVRDAFYDAARLVGQTDGQRDFRAVAGEREPQADDANDGDGR